MSVESKHIAWAITLLAAGGALLLSRRKSNPPSLINDNTYSEYDMSTDPKLPRGYRNNNPLNIRISSNAWKGKIKDNTDGAFEQFVSLPYGYRAALATMRTYIRKYGCNTVEKIINRWAPPTENNTDAYIKHVCQYADVAPQMTVALNDRDTLTKMAYAMSIIENGTKDKAGQNLYETYGLPDMEIINQAWELL